MKSSVGYLCAAWFLLHTVYFAIPTEAVESCWVEFAPYPGDCGKYIICNGGNPIVMSCTPGLHWNDAIKTCDYPYRANCVEEPNKPVQLIKMSQNTSQSSSIETDIKRMYNTHFDADEKVWFGNKNEFKVDARENFGEIVLKKLAEGDSERVLQIDGDTGESLTRAEVRRRSIRFAQNLKQIGLTPDDRIVIISRNHHNLTPLVFASLCIGSSITSLDLSGDGMDKIIERLQPSFIFCDADVLESVEKILKDIKLKAKLLTVDKMVDGFDSIDDSLMSETGDDHSFVCTKLADSYSHPAFIPSSSGSTGLAKSIILSHAFFIDAFSSDTGAFLRKSLCFSSINWITGIFNLINPAFKGTRVFTAQPFSTDLFFDLVEKYKVESFFGVPSQLQAIQKSERRITADLSSILIISSGGSSMPPSLVKSLKETMPWCTLMSVYGSTELGIVSITWPKELEEYPTAVGHLVRGLKVKIISEQTNETCGIGEEGEIYMKPSISTIGYYGDEAATQSAFDKDGYFITGDIGYFDEAGRLYISGRKKEMFKVRNHVIWPSELEDIIGKNPAVRLVCVVNVFDDDIASDLPAAVVVKDEQQEISEDGVYALIADQMADYKRLDGGVYFVDEIPKTPTGKVMRFKVKEMAQKLYQKKQQK